MIDFVETVRSLMKTRWLCRTGQTREQFDGWQQRALQKWLLNDVPEVQFYKTSSGKLSDLPIIDKATVMQDFSAFNKHGVNADQVRTALSTTMKIGKLTVGASTGTSGNRGFFVISEQEKFRWLGTMLAKTMPDLLLQKQRVAVLLPQGGQLYDSANNASRIELKLFNLVDGVEQWRDQLEAFNPTLIVAPPKVLRYLSEENYRLTPKRIFSAAETLDPMDRMLVEAHFETKLEQIYMATEGLLGVTCRHGTLHLAEDSIHFEYESVSDDLVMPIVTCFQRTTQIMARYRMNDLLRLSDKPCPCGSPLQAVDEIVGRMDDCFEFTTNSNTTILVTPDVLRNTILDANRRIDDFKLSQIGPEAMVLKLPVDLTDGEIETVKSALCILLKKRNVDPKIETERVSFSLDTSRKLRRVERCFVAKDIS